MFVDIGVYRFVLQQRDTNHNFFCWLGPLIDLHGIHCKPVGNGHDPNAHVGNQGCCNLTPRNGPRAYVF